jgi:RNA polymerase sigma factor (TIGR02999 family)
MRRILVEKAREKKAQKRGGGRQQIDLEGVSAPFNMPAEELIELDGALLKLATVEPEVAKLVDLKYFGGMTTGQIAHMRSVSERTIFSQLAYARAWLHREMTGEDSSGP